MNTLNSKKVQITFKIILIILKQEIDKTENLYALNKQSEPQVNKNIMKQTRIMRNLIN
ncbi:hypothetical protein pb186bvf_002708 [Paramecium bursaria]